MGNGHNSFFPVIIRVVINDRHSNFVPLLKLGWFAAAIELLEVKLILLNTGKLLFFSFLASELLLEHLGSRHPCLLIQHSGFEPSIRQVQFTLNLFPHVVELKNTVAKLGPNAEVILFRELP